MYISVDLQEKILNLHEKCRREEKATTVVLKNIGDFDPIYVEFENALKKSELSDVFDLKFYGYSFENDKEIDNAFRFVSYEDPDIVVVLSEDIGSSSHKKLLLELSHKEDVILCSVGKKDTIGNGELFFDIVFNSPQEFVKFFKKACGSIGVREGSKMMKVNSVDDALSYISKEDTDQSPTVQAEEPAQVRNQTSLLYDRYMELSLAVREIQAELARMKKLLESKDEKDERSNKMNTGTGNVFNLINSALLLTLIALILLLR